MTNPPRYLPSPSASGFSCLAGFTLVEMLVATALLTVMCTMMFGTLDAVSRIWTGAQANLEPRQNGRTIIELMSQELQSALLPKDPTNMQSLEFMVNPPAATVGASCLNPSAVFFQAPVASASGTNYYGGNVAEIGYFVQWVTPTPPAGSNATSPPAPRLCRYYVTPANNPSNSNSFNPDFLIYTSNPWVTNNLLQEYAPANSATNYRGWFADNVIGLWVTCLDKFGNPITKYANPNPPNPWTPYAFDSRQGYVDSKGNAHDGTVKSGPVAWVSALPSSVNISLVMIDSRTAERISTASIATQIETFQTQAAQNPSNPNTDVQKFLNKLIGSGGALKLIGQNARVYSMNVPLQNAQ